MTAPREASDAELLQRLRAGDAGALDALLQRYWAPLVAYVRRMVGSADAADDITQRTFQRLWERRATWRPAGSVRGLLYRIARNLAITEYRADRARARADSVSADAATAPATPLQRLENAELGAALDRAIAALPARRREVFILRCVHDLPYNEIARIMGISPQTVANQLSHALATLRVTLGSLLDR